MESEGEGVGMRSIFRRFGAVIAPACLVAACSALPSFNNVVGPSDAAPEARDLVQHIQCEFYRIEADKNNPLAEQFRRYKFIVFATLTFEVTNNQNITPTLSFIDTVNVSPAGTLTKLFGGQVSGMQHRTMTESFLLDLGSQKSDAASKCLRSTEMPLVGGIQGDLGIKEIVFAGMQAMDFIYEYVPDDSASSTKSLMPGPQALEFQSLSETLKKKYLTPKLGQSSVPTIGSTIDFTVILGFNGGPLWSLVDFKGPSGPNGLAGVTTTWKDTLTFSVAPTTLSEPPKGLKDALTKEIDKVNAETAESNKPAAAAAAANAVTRQLLQLSPFNNTLVP
jgi:hypothetical protein